MCAIDVCVSAAPVVASDDSLKSRGPDAVKETLLSPWSGKFSLAAAGTVLHIRGNEIVRQPLITEHWIVLWNGEIFDGLDVSGSDTRALCDELEKSNGQRGPFDAVFDVLSNINAEFACVIGHIPSGEFFFARDRFGRRSLLITADNSDVNNSTWSATSLRLRSVLPDDVDMMGAHQTWREVDAGCLYRVQVANDVMKVGSTPWPDSNACGYRLYATKQSSAICTLESGQTLPAQDFLAQLERSFQRILVGADRQVAILFSGGVDSVAMAAMCARVLPKASQIDLLNVAFATDTAPADAAPDRLAAKHALTELQSLFPNTTWRLITRDVTREEYDAARSVVSRLLFPASTVMDLSIGIALWFATSADYSNQPKSNIQEACVYTPETYSNFESGSCGSINQCNEQEAGSKIVLVGVGADELLGGYSRIRQAYAHGSWHAVAAELDTHVRRIGKRNLGRDDRIVASHGREARFPFLEEELVSFIMQLPVDAKCDARLPRGVGEKRILREALQKLGFSVRVTQQLKSAIQFGSRAAKLQDAGLKGTDLISGSTADDV